MPRDQRPVMTPPMPLMPPQSGRPATDTAAIVSWLARGHPDPGKALKQWQEHRIALMPLGRAYSAIRIPARLVHAVVGSSDRSESDAFIATALRGPVIADRAGVRYYALVAPLVPPNYGPHVGDRWGELGVEILGTGTDMGVPRHGTAFDPEVPLRSYWVVPVASAGQLCDPARVVRLIATARAAMTESPET